MAPNMMLPNGMILPKGIVMNHDLIYHSVAEYPIVPREQIYEYWHVYTVTCRTLIDPTAQRLENFWWHVLGSNRRELSGKTLARLFEDISKGPTFVRLRGPPNRYEGPPDDDPSLPVAESAAAPTGKAESREIGDSKGTTDGTEQTKIQPSQSSSSRPPPPHPILKKPRGPSTSGPRPTARFVSPPGSEDEDDNQAEGGPSSSRKKAPLEKESGSGSQGASAAKGERKKSTSTVPKKKPTFVASAARRRPTMPRRQSSQSSTGVAEVGSKDGGSSASSRSGSQRPVSPIAERASKKSTQGARETRDKISAKAAGKLPADELKSTSVHDSASFRVIGGTLPVIVPDDNASSAKNGPETSGKGKKQMDGSHQRDINPTSTRALPQPNKVVTAPLMSRTRSDNGSRQAVGPREGFGRVPPHGLISSSTATTSNVAARGTMTDFDDHARGQAIPGQEGRSEVVSPIGGSLRDSRFIFTPTPPSNAPSVPLGRSKSQLTLLLERQNEKKSSRR